MARRTKIFGSMELPLPDRKELHTGYYASLSNCLEKVLTDELIHHVAMLEQDYQKACHEGNIQPEIFADVIGLGDAARLTITWQKDFVSGSIHA